MSLTALKRGPNGDHTDGSENQLLYEAFTVPPAPQNHQRENPAPKEKIHQALNTYIHRLHATPQPPKGQEVER